jgi:predicted glycosyl hydrolase (DUF1957 family)
MTNYDTEIFGYYFFEGITGKEGRRLFLTVASNPSWEIKSSDDRW